MAGRVYTTAYCKWMTALLLAVTILACGLAGCGASQTAREEGSVSVYYLSKDRTTITASTYLPDAGLLREDHAGELIAELLVRLETPENASEQTAPIDENSVISWDLADGLLTLDMSSAYRKQDQTTEILARGAIVSTMCGIHGVDLVAFTVEGEPLRDADGDVIGGQSGEDFIFSSDSELRSYEQVRLHLYFADESGTGLVSTYRTVVYNSNIALERLVAEEVLKGPNTDVVYPTINPYTEILSVTTRDETCYVNLDRNFLTDPYDVTSRVAIYSLVNSLTELPSVTSVQISIEGDTQESLMDTSLRNEFERDLSLVTNS